MTDGVSNAGTTSHGVPPMPGIKTRRRTKRQVAHLILLVVTTSALQQKVGLVQLAHEARHKEHVDSDQTC